MRAAVLYGPHDFRIEDRPTPYIDTNQCLIQIKACGVCHSEIHQWQVKTPGLEYPRMIGHEVAGVVLKIGPDVKRFREGDRVAVWVDGKGYAEEAAVNEERVFPIATDVPFTEAMAEPIACTVNGVNKAGVQLGETVGIIGTGFMGLILLQELKLLGLNKLIAIDIRDEMLAVAKKLGADITINPQKEDPRKIIDSLTNNRGLDVCIEAGGSQATLDLAADLCRMEGKLVIFGYHPGSRIIKDLGYWNWMAFDIRNAHFRDVNIILQGMRIGMDLLNMGKISLKTLVTDQFKFEDIENAFSAAQQKPKGFIKGVLVMD